MDSGSLVRALAADGAVRIVAVDVAAAADEVRRRHGLGRDAARVGADSVVAAALMSAHIKGDERMTLQIQGELPRLAVYAEVDAAGVIRARVTPSDLRTGPDGRMSGVLVAAKSDAAKEMYRGATPLEDGTVQTALATHLGSSAQVDSALRIHSEVDGTGAVSSARGVLIEKLPAADLGQEVRAAAILEVLRDQSDAEVLAAVDAGSLFGEAIEVLERRPLIWRCRCSRARVEATLRGLGADEVRAMLEEDGGAEVTCHFCNEVYAFDADALRALL